MFLALILNWGHDIDRCMFKSYSLLLFQELWKSLFQNVLGFLKDVCGKPVTVWECDLFDLSSFLLVQNIKCRTVSLVDKLDDVYGNVLFISPYE